MCDVSVLAVSVATCELMLTYWNPGDVVGIGGLDLSPAMVSALPGDVISGGSGELAMILRPSVPALAGTERVIKRVAVATTQTGVIFSMADVGGDPVMLGSEWPDHIGVKLYCRSSGGGSIALLTNWSWSEEPAKGVF